MEFERSAGEVSTPSSPEVQSIGLRGHGGQFVLGNDKARGSTNPPTPSYGTSLAAPSTSHPYKAEPVIDLQGQGRILRSVAPQPSTRILKPRAQCRSFIWKEPAKSPQHRQNERDMTQPCAPPAISSRKTRKGEGAPKPAGPKARRSSRPDSPLFRPLFQGRTRIGVGGVSWLCKARFSAAAVPAWVANVRCFGQGNSM